MSDVKLSGLLITTSTEDFGEFLIQCVPHYTDHSLCTQAIFAVRPRCQWTNAGNATADGEAAAGGQVSGDGLLIAFIQRKYRDKDGAETDGMANQ